ncbi:hypothetical protein ABZT03_19095 [Streptomyces sp. NPDC005574]|uniref:hypothetical protein n=1 Tax=Streptomyces sp. NPDC005574 TaxID=3156891 RepID=UPI0033BCCFF6
MTTEIDTEDRAADADDDLHTLARHIIRTARPGGDRAAAQALVDEQTILALPHVRRNLIVHNRHREATCHWEGLSGLQYTLGLDERQRAFLGLVLSMVGIGHITIAAAQSLDERRLGIITRAILQLAGNDTLAVGTRL